MNPPATVVIPARNAASTIDAQLAALSRQRHSHNFEIIVVDDGSRDDTATRAESWQRRLPLLSVVRLSSRQGPCNARNLGAQRASNELLLYCDADDVVADDWVGQLTRAAQTAHLVGGRLDEVTLNAGRVRRRRPAQPTEHLPTALGHLPYAHGANLAIWKRVLTDIGCWDEAIDAGTDVDLCWRAHLAGYKLSYAPAAVVAYRYRSTRRGFFTQTVRWGLADTRLRQRYKYTKPPLLRPGATPTALRSIVHRRDSALRVGAYVLGRAIGLLLCAVRRQAQTDLAFSGAGVAELPPRSVW